MNDTTNYILTNIGKRLLEEDWPINYPDKQQALLSRIGLEVMESFRGDEKAKEQLTETINAIVNGPIDDPTDFEGKAEAAMRIYLICESYEERFNDLEE